MTRITHSSKPVSVNPLKSSQPLGAAFAYLGIESSVPLFHGSQGCTSFALVLLVRHFKETIPLQTTAMDEVQTVLGGAENLEEAILNLTSRTKARFIGVATTALVETRGEDIVGEVADIRRRRATELEGTTIAVAQTPDFDGAIEEGWQKAVTATLEALAGPRGGEPVIADRVNVLAASHLTVADVELLRDTIAAFGLEATILPDISGALDGTVPDRWVPTTYGGTPLEAVRAMPRAACTIAIGEHMRAPGRRLAGLGGMPLVVFDTLTGLKSVDRLMSLLAEVSGRPVPAGIRRRRNQLTDAMLDGHFHFGGKRIAIAAEPDLLFALSGLFGGLGAEVVAAVTTTSHSPILERVSAPAVTVGDLGDLEGLARGAGVDLIVTHSHGRQAAERLGVPLMRVGFPIFDRLGSQHRRTILYEGTRDLIFEVANIFQGELHAPSPEDLNPFRRREKEEHHDRSPPAAH
ncbi:MAG: nitrogenase iron-molybdenum cofactor biosynthesis protein NifN [Hyphomicrobiaceae bacterium]|nr:nitrogenase iron-molybdenum cofactor biosynthesis protein NifN [Hyphomicrobiaceae bacterium]